MQRNLWKFANSRTSNAVAVFSVCVLAFVSIGCQEELEHWDVNDRGNNPGLQGAATGTGIGSNCEGLLVEGWSKCTVDDSAQAIGMYPSIDLDQSGTLHVGYMDLINRSFHYAYTENNAWKTEQATIVDGTGGDPFTGGTQGSTSIKVDAEGRVHLILYDSGLNVIKYAVRDTGGTWVTEEVAGVVEGYASLGVDSQGTVHVVFSGSSEIIQYAQKATGEDWVVTPLSGESGTFTALEIDAMDRVHVLYSGTGRMSYMVREAGGAWSAVSEIDSAPGFYGDIAVHSDGTVHAAWFNQADIKVIYKFGTPGAWATAEVDAAMDGVSRIDEDISVDSSNGQVHLFYWYQQTNNLYYATRGGNAGLSFEPAELTKQKTGGGYPASLVDPEGAVHVVMFQYNSCGNAGAEVCGQLSYATYDPSLIPDE